MGFEEQQPFSDGRPPRRTRRWLVFGGVATVLAASAILVGFTSSTQAAEAEARSSATISAAHSRSAEATRLSDLAKAREAKELADQRIAAESLKEQESAAKARTDSEIRQMADQGWESAGNQLYFHYLDHSQFSCGSWKCTYLDVVSMATNGCPAGIYLAASIDRGNVSIGSTNEFTAGVPKGKVARVKLEDTSNRGEGFQLTTMTCHG